jgi:pimeloyl-ACP methyl ester carboxylesterase
MAQTTQIRELTATVAGCELRATAGGEGPPVVVLDHSIADRRWHGVHDALAQQFTVHALDLPGFNRGPRPDWARDVRDLALLVAGYLRKQVGTRALLVGSEFGGWVAAEVAVLAPDVVRGLALVGSAGLLPAEGRIVDMMLTSHSGYARDCFSSDDAYDTFFEGGLTDDRLLTWDFNREMVARVAWKPYMYNRRLAPMLAEVTAPAVVVRGSADRIVPQSCADQFIRLLPNATFEVVDGCGNAVALEQPEALASFVGALAAR